MGDLRRALARQGEGSDLRVDIHVADAYKVEDGKVTRVIVGFPDVATALRAVGLEE